jgi:hypothetical protein
MPEVNWGDAEDQAEFSSAPTGTSRAGRTPRGRRVSDKRLQSLQQKLSTEMFSAGAMIGLGVPVTGYYICQESENFTTAVCQLASHRTEWVTALENIALLGPGLIVGRTALGMGAALAADRYYRTGGETGLDPTRQVAMFLGVSAAYYAVHPPEGKNNAAKGSGFAPPPNSGVFVPVAPV